MRISANLLLPCSVALMLLSGCNHSTTHGTIHGTVTLDGTPLDEGVVRFVPVDGKSPTASATVAAGEFQAVVPVGVMRVECSAPQVVGRQKMYDTADSPEVDVVGELLPARYNLRSELTRKVAAGSQQFSLELTSK